MIVWNVTEARSSKPFGNDPNLSVMIQHISESEDRLPRMTGYGPPVEVILVNGSAGLSPGLTRYTPPIDGAVPLPLNFGICGKFQANWNFAKSFF